MRNALRRGVEKLNFGMDKYMPDSLVLAFALTVVTFIFGMVAASQTPWQMILHWTKGFWDFLSFSMQMFVALAGGYAAASSPPGKAALRKLARIPKSSLSAILFTAYFLAVISWFNWAVGMIVAAFLAREIAANHSKLDFKLLVAVGYCVSICIGILGPSTPEFLISATPGSFMEKYLGKVVPLSDTIFDTGLVVGEVLTFFIAIPLLIWVIHPDKDKTPELDAKVMERFRLQDQAALELRQSRKPKSEMTFAERCDNSPILNYIICIPGFIYIVYYFATKGFNLTLDIMNFIVLMLGILLHGTPASLNKAFEEGARGAYGIALQFPIYAGIQGMIGGSGLIAIIANYFASISTPDNFVHWTYLTGVVLNIFVPSSGGLFMVAGPALATAGGMLTVPPNETIIAFTAGEVMSNMIQPFWAISLLGIAGLKMKDIMGYCILFFIISSIIFNVCMRIFW
jgi:short-chain fatty acids transporter